MRSAMALVRASFLTAMSYRMAIVTSLATLIFQVLPTYYIGRTLQPFMGPAIRNEGSDYFSFLVVGTVAYVVLAAAVAALPRAVENGISAGTIESLFGTPSSLAGLIVGLSGYELLWAVARAGVLLVVAGMVGAQIDWLRLPAALVILALIGAAYFAIGLFAAGMILAFRRAGPFLTIVVVGSALLGGVTYPTSMVPSWLGSLTHVVPLTYGLRALRRTLIDVAPASAVIGDVAVLALIAGVLLVLGWRAFAAALGHARRVGTMAQY